MTCEQYLIQNLMWKQCLSEQEFRQVADKCLNVADAGSRHAQRTGTQTMTAEEVSDLVKRVNRKIGNLNLQISRGPNETDGTIHYALINTADNEMTRSANRLPPKELLYFRKLVAAIVQSDHSCIPSTKALNISREDDIKFTMTAADNALKKWLEERWFEEVADGKIALGVRTLLEMNVYLRERFAVQDCYRCKALCVRGDNCVNCDIKLHFHCVDSQFIPNNKCPNCSKEWTNPSADRRNDGSTNGSETEEEEVNRGPEEEEEEATEEENEEVIRRERRSKKKRL